MEIKRRTNIVITTERKITVRRGNEQILFECSRCRAIMISPEDAASAHGDNPREVYRRIEAGTIPFIETADKKIFVCTNCDESPQ